MRCCEVVAGRWSGCIDMVRGRMRLTQGRAQQGHSLGLLGWRPFSCRMHEAQLGILARIDIRINCFAQEATE